MHNYIAKDFYGIFSLIMSSSFGLCGYTPDYMVKVVLGIFLHPSIHGILGLSVFLPDTLQRVFWGSFMIDHIKHF